MLGHATSQEPQHAPPVLGGHVAEVQASPVLGRTQGFVDRSADSTEAASPRQGGDEGHERSKEVRVPEDALLRGGLHFLLIARGFGYLGGFYRN